MINVVNFMIGLVELLVLLGILNLALKLIFRMTFIGRISLEILKSMNKILKLSWRLSKVSWKNGYKNTVRLYKWIDKKRKDNKGKDTQEEQKVVGLTNNVINFKDIKKKRDKEK